MNQCEDREEGDPPSKTSLCGEHEDQRIHQSPESAKPEPEPEPGPEPEPEPSCVSFKSDQSKPAFIDFKHQHVSDRQVDQDSSEVPSHQSAQQHQTHLEFTLYTGNSQPGNGGWLKLAETRRGCSLSQHRCIFFILVLGAVLFVLDTITKEMVPDWNPKAWMQYNSTKSWTNLHASASVVTRQKLVPPTLYKTPGPYLVEYPYEYHFIINEPKKCEQEKPFLVLVVPVAPHNREHRDIVRSTWGGESLVLDKVVKLFFLLGLHTGEGAEHLQEQLLQESKEHQDLIQSDFLDCYKNLTIKTMVMLEWLDSHCSSATYAMKIDSDMFLNLPNLINMLLNAPKTNYMTGLVESEAEVLRDPNSKWYLPVEIYPQSQYPRYALGLGYVLSLDLPEKLVEASRHVTALYIEDVYLGLCMQHLGISPTDPPNWGYFNNNPVAYSRCAYSKLIATTTYENTDRVANWKDFKKMGPYCQSLKEDKAANEGLRIEY